MAILFRVFLIALLIYLVVKLVKETLAGPKEDEDKVKSGAKSRKVSKDVGEYVDFEEVDKDKRRKTKDERHTDKEQGVPKNTNL